MLVRKQMILTVLIITVALGAITEYQIVPILLSPATDRAFMNTGPLLTLLHAPAVDLSPMYLLRRIALCIPHTEEENQEVAQGHQRHHRIGRMRHNARLNQRQNRIIREVRRRESGHNRHAKINGIDNTQPFSP